MWLIEKLRRVSIVVRQGPAGARNKIKIAPPPTLFLYNKISWRVFLVVIIVKG